jgi:hypothetical protein
MTTRITGKSRTAAAPSKTANQRRIAKELQRTYSATRDRLLEAIVVGFERSATADDARANGVLVERGGPFPVALAQRLEAAARSNRHIAAVRGLREQIQRVSRAIGKQSS